MSTITILGYVNQALMMIGQERLSAMTDDASVARDATSTWPTLRQEMIGGHPWRFATKQADTLAALAVQPTTWTYAYALPADCLRFIRIVGEGAVSTTEPLYTGGMTAVQFPYEVRGLQLFTDVETPTIEYVADVANPAEWPTDFGEAFVLNLAAHLAMRTTDRIPLAARFRDEYRVALRAAKAADANQAMTVLPYWPNPLCDARK